MLNKKIIAGLISALMVLVSLTGCGNSGNTNSAGSVGLPADSVESGEQNEAQKEQTGAKILAQNSNVGNITSTDAGMYRIVYEELADKTWGYKLYYVDYKTAKEIVLCNDSSCSHDNENCAGIIKDDNLVFPNLFIYNNQLYVFSSNDEAGSSYSIFGDSDEVSVSTRLACLYKMNLDGTDRHHVINFPEDSAIDENVFEWNGQLVFGVKQLESKKGADGSFQLLGVNRKLMSLDAETGKLTDLVDFDQEYTVNGTYKDYIICSKTIYPDGYTDEDTLDMEYEEWRELMSRSENSYVLFNLSNGETTEICKVDQKEYLNDCMVLDGKIYISKGTPEILCIDIETGKQSETVIKDGESFALVSTLGDCIYCWIEDNYDETYFWNPEKCSLTKADMKIKGTDLNGDILAYNDDLIVCVCDGESEKYEDGSYEIKSQTYGLVDKADLYNGKVNITPVMMCSNGINQ